MARVGKRIACTFYFENIESVDHLKILMSDLRIILKWKLNARVRVRREL